MVETLSKLPLSSKFPAEAMDELASIFEAYNETANRVHRSHEQLQSEVIRLRHELEQKNEQLQRKSRLAALGEMAAAIAHEIRNPLGGVQLYASLLERDLQEQATQLDWVQKISRGVRSMDQIVNDVLTFAQDQPCCKTQVQLAGLLAEVMDYVQPQLQDKAIVINSASIPKGFSFHADVNMMRQILLNLILNAIDALGVKGEIAVKAIYLESDSEFSAQVQVCDSGSGLPDEEAEKIFNPFYTTKDSGIGLGLAIVHRLMECHQGSISAVSNAVGGATFTLLLP